MTPGSFAQSLGKQFTQSLGLQRGHGGGEPLQTWEAFIIQHFTERPLRDNQGSNQPPFGPIDQNILVGELNALDWDFINHGAVGSIREYVITYDPSRVVHSYNFAAQEFEWKTYPLQTSYPINNMFPALPVFTPSGGTATPYIGQVSRQCSFWKTQVGIDGPRQVWRSWVQLQKTRYKWNRVVTHGFFAVANVWWLDQFGYKYGENPDPDYRPLDYLQQDGSHGRISIEDVNLISEHTNVAPNTWIYPPYSFSQGQPGTFTTGFAGQIMLSIDFETPAQWSARTGIQIH